MRAPVLAVGLTLASIITPGCGGATTRPFVAGPSSIAEGPLFQRAVETARAHGYDVVEENAAGGRFVVQAHTTGNRGQLATFVVQFYRPGWVQITAESSAVRRDGDQMHMSGSLYEEYRDFSVWIAGLVGPGGAPGATVAGSGAVP